ncbi:hypothetical protein BJ973_002746 [Actinoplanes tereljensis]|uniref:hypothetical protein n=1 Tax=Paractinoplanes tereljensis TaxID=571912 RepID=UPI001942BEA6|nr:hypothetical protein [Actinoplanes tereljensis]
MGYSGLVIIARTGDTRLDELACVDDLFVAVTDNVRAGGWRIGFLGPVDDTSPEDLANDLALETVAPAIALLVFDSDCAWATAADPAGDTVDFHLSEETIRLLVTDGGDSFEPLNGQALAGLLVWAGKAGLFAGSGQLAAALEECPGPFGDGIFAFAEALGIAELPEQHN